MWNLQNLKCSERLKILKSLAYCDFRSEQEALREKLKSLEKKILVGGENLLEKADIQGQLLMQSAQELQERATEEEQLRKELERREVE